MKIRLGNDIRLKVQLPVSNVNGKKASILSARAFFLNKTLNEELEKKYIKKNRFIGRFPIEPFVDEFEPTAYNINCSGFSKYRVFARNEYKGFGFNPNWKECLPIRDEDMTIYESSIERTPDPKEIIVMFPAYALKHIGEYELVITAEIYDSGYTSKSRTITINTNTIFELVKDSGLELDTIRPIYLDVTMYGVTINTQGDPLPGDDIGDPNTGGGTSSSEDIYVVEGTYDDNNITIVRNDRTRINIDVSPISGWHEE